jgi:hypothetical protein
LRVCHIKGEYKNKTFSGIATKGKSTVRWFLSFKLHLVINDKGKIIEFFLSPANTNDRETLKNRCFHEQVFAKIFGDKGYISQDLFERLFIDIVHLVTGIKKNMKNSLMHLSDKIYLRKRALIETVNDELKNICQIEHTRYRCFNNFINNMIAAFIAYNFLSKKPH